MQHRTKIDNIASSGYIVKQALFAVLALYGDVYRPIYARAKTIPLIPLSGNFTTLASPKLANRRILEILRYLNRCRAKIASQSLAIPLRRGPAGWQIKIDSFFRRTAAIPFSRGTRFEPDIKQVPVGTALVAAVRAHRRMRSESTERRLAATLRCIPIGLCCTPRRLSLGLFGDQLIG